MRNLPICILGLLGLMLSSGICAGQTDNPPVGVCSELLDKGKRFTGSSDREVYRLGIDKLREAERICDSPRMPPDVRARTLMLTTRLYSGDWERQRKMWASAASLLRTDAPDSRLLPLALEGLSSVEFTLKNYDESVRLAIDASEERRRLFGEKSREYVRGLTLLAATYHPLAEIRDQEFNSRQALKYAEQAFATAQELFGLRDGTTVTAAATLITVLRSRGLGIEADRLAEEIQPYLDLEDPVDQSY